MCFLSTTFPNAPAHPPPPLYFLTSPLIWNVFHFLPKFEFSLIQGGFLGPFRPYFIADKDYFATTSSLDSYN